MNKRLEMLEHLVRKQGTIDPFAWYGLAMEYRRLGRNQDALDVFTELRQRSPDYLPMYLMAGQLALESGDRDGARGWLNAGCELATAQGDAKAGHELEDLLENLDA
jgi:predicted Zn-dependent protease